MLEVALNELPEILRREIDALEAVSPEELSWSRDDPVPWTRRRESSQEDQAAFFLAPTTRTTPMY
jgi:hypothetical protein